PERAQALLEDGGLALVVDFGPRGRARRTVARRGNARCRRPVAFRAIRQREAAVLQDEGPELRESPIRPRARGDRRPGPAVEAVRAVRPVHADRLRPRVLAGRDAPARWARASIAPADRRRVTVLERELDEHVGRTRRERARAVDFGAKARARDDPLAGRGIAPRLEGARDRAARRVRLLRANPAVGLATGEVQPHGRKVVEVLREGARRSPVDACEARARLEARREPAAAGAREAALESRWHEAQRGAAERGERPPLRARP